MKEIRLELLRELDRRWPWDMPTIDSCLQACQDDVIAVEAFFAVAMAIKADPAWVIERALGTRDHVS
jgi:hypothetical protein